MKMLALTAAVAALVALPAAAAAPPKGTVPVVTGTAAKPHLLPMHFVGKVKREKQGVSYQWPGIYFEARFSGLTVGLAFDDNANNFNVLVDGKLLMIVKKPGHRLISIEAGDAGPHTIRVEKRSETQYATGHFIGFYGSPAPLPAPPARQIEFIGDSFTVGYGNTSAFKDCTPEDIFETTDAQESFPALVGKHFNADYQNNAFSGLGMVRNYDGREHAKYRMPMLYPRAIFDDPAPAVQPDWHPQIFVMRLGGNDFSTDLRPDEPWKTRADLVTDYEKTFVRFIKDRRAENPGAFILIAAPPVSEAEYHTAITAVFDALKAGGETHIDELTLPETDDTGCNGHPNIRDDKKVADVIDTYIEAHPALWQGK